MKKKAWAILGIAVILFIGGFALYWHTHIGNRQLMDMKYQFDRAILKLPDGEVIEGKLSSWLDYTDSDVIQVKIDGKTYLTSYVNVCLIDD